MLKRFISYYIFLIIFCISFVHAADFYNVNNGSTVTINEHTVCRKVTNSLSGGRNLFVPTKTSGEWASFYNNVPGGVSCTNCCKEEFAICGSDEECCMGVCTDVSLWCNAACLENGLPCSHTGECCRGECLPAGGIDRCQ